MKIAVVAVTIKGLKLAERTAALLSETGEHKTVLYVPGKFSLLRIEGERQPYRKPLRELFRELFKEYEGIICIMALGIVMRLSAPHLRDKTVDPAVVVVDELGQNVISALSGHLGGANRLTVQLAGLLEANPVITTATDVNGLPAVEMLAVENGWTVEPFELVKKINSDLVNDKKIFMYTEYPLNIELPEQIELREFARYSPGRREDGRVILITNRSSKNFPHGTMFLRPANLFIGIGCRRDVSDEEVREAINAALEETGRALSSVRSIASIDIKSNEQGLLDAAEELKLPVEFLSREQIVEVLDRRQDLSYSEMVKDRIGVGGVCEPAAILSAGETSVLIMPKTRYGRVTVAIAEGGWQ